MASYNDNGKLELWENVGEADVEVGGRPAIVLRHLQDERFLEGAAAKLHRRLMSGNSMYKMQKLGRQCIKMLPYLTETGTLGERKVAKTRDGEKFENLAGVMASQHWPTCFMSMAQVSMCTALIEERRLLVC